MTTRRKKNDYRISPLGPSFLLEVCSQKGVIALSQNWIGKTDSRRALNCIGSFLYRAMYLDGNLNFTVTTRKRKDGSCTICVLHPEGTFEFEVPEAERKAEAARLRSQEMD